MPKAATPLTLNLNSSKQDGLHSPSVGALSPRSISTPQTPRSPPVSPTLPPQNPSIATQVQGQSDPPASPQTGTTVQEPPRSPAGRSSPRQHSRDASKSFFSNLMASKSSHRLHSPESSIAESNDRPNGRSRANSKDRSLQQSIKKQTSTPDLPRLTQGATGGKQTLETQSETQSLPQPPGSSDGTISKQKSKTKLGGLLTRSRSGKPEDDKKQKAKSPVSLTLEMPSQSDNSLDNPYVTPLKTAPIRPEHRDQAFVMEVNSAQRNRSADRIALNDTHKNGQHQQHQQQYGPHGSKDSSSLFANIHATGRGVGDRLGRAGRGWFSKMTRSTSANEREIVTDDNYVCSTINLPLIKQTRKTRIAKRLELSKDKTEFWMPALPWRCIDYLNMQCEQEGLYRVPGSGRDVKFWQRRFDTEHDINLFDEPELYDVNTIASMFKAWLRDLPDELLPKAIQSKIAKQCMGATKTPQLLKDELSQLPPFNYYLLFAITCHLSLLHSYSDQNKMDYRNLCICFQPCLKIDAFCFQFLVIDWKECWQQGCWTEKQFLEEEYRWEREGSINEPSESAIEDRAVSSSGSSNTATVQSSQPPQIPPRPPGSADGLRKPTTTNATLRPKQRSLSSGGSNSTRTPNHGHAATAPAVPRLVSTTPDHPPIEEKGLPELGSLSPIRM